MSIKVNVLKCLQCGSPDVEETKENLYRCKSCGTSFIVANDADKNTTTSTTNYAERTTINDSAGMYTYTNEKSYTNTTTSSDPTNEVNDFKGFKWAFKLTSNGDLKNSVGPILLFLAVLFAFLLL